MRQVNFITRISPGQTFSKSEWKTEYSLDHTSRVCRSISVSIFLQESLDWKAEGAFKSMMTLPMATLRNLIGLNLKFCSGLICILDSCRNRRALSNIEWGKLSFLSSLSNIPLRLKSKCQVYDCVKHRFHVCLCDAYKRYFSNLTIAISSRPNCIFNDKIDLWECVPDVLNVRT